MLVTLFNMTMLVTVFNITQLVKLSHKIKKYGSSETRVLVEHENSTMLKPKACKKSHIHFNLPPILPVDGPT